MNNLGNLHSEIQMFDNAMKYFNQAYALSEKKGELYADPLINMGNVYFRQGNYQRAVHHYERALEIEREKNNSISVLNILSNLGITFTKAKQPQRAQVYLDEANRMCHELRAFSFLPTIYKTQSENYATQGMWKDAYESMAAYEKEREKIYSEESSRRIAQLEILMQFQEIERKHDALLKESQIDKLELRSNRLLITIIVLILLCALGGYNFFNVNRKALIKRKNVAQHAN
jgi:tetratricopeptide (TPR) repeat protein